ncbi:DEKNAAC104088 [Brettanomyces naardenensis]|uniref:DEKNAAC104088 n=1 Tax=Brettanomyces naardenensis TaxID=13370 RepID=A0A448YQF8_BRENA|nr:DEKNAAC104088 [Brettanomyces naardenensis]
MSFKGFQKAIARAPQTFRQKMHMGEQTEDAVYEDAERRFKELEIQTKRLNDESKRYHKAVDDMLDHQIGFSKAIEEIYKPISGKASDPNSTIPEGNPEGIEACVQYREVMSELKDTLKPDLDLIDTKIVQPAQELLKIITAIRKMATKRNHKQLDLDRFQNTLKGLQTKRDKADETKAIKYQEKIYKAENDLAVAQQEYDYYNEMMKTELPVMFRMESEFIHPLFISLYYMQLNVFYTLSSRLEEMKIPYFDLSSDIIEAFKLKRGDVEERSESIGITHFRVAYSRSKLDMTKQRLAMEHGGAPGQPAYGQPGYGQPGYGQPAYGQAATAAPAYGQPGYGQPGAAPAPAPAYGAAPTYGAAAPVAATAAYGQPAAAPAPAPGSYQTPPPSTSTASGYPYDQKTPAAYGQSPPATAAAPPPAYSAGSAAETCTALYDYTAQAEGDLSFTAGSQITVIKRTADENDWWTGSVNGATGVFPGNYVKIN